MPCPYENLTEDEARRELSRRHHPDDRPGGRDAWLDQFGYGPAPLFGGTGWPCLPAAYGAHPNGYGPYRRPDPMRRRGPGHGEAGERNFMDRAGDEIASWFGDDETEAGRDAGPKAMCVRMAGAKKISTTASWMIRLWTPARSPSASRTAKSRRMAPSPRAGQKNAPTIFRVWSTCRTTCASGPSSET